MGLYLPAIAYAFTAGILSIFSPCGYVLLPGYVSFYLGSKFSVTRAFSGGLACTLGLITLYSIVGGLSSSLGTLLKPVIPMLDLLAAVVLIVLGIVTIMEMRLPYLSISAKPSQRRGLLGLYLFGIVYGFAGVGCSAPIFLSVLLYSFSGGFANGVLSFISYAIGMGIPLVVTSVLLAQAKEYIISKISGATPLLNKISGIVLIFVGLYLLYFSSNTYLSLLPALLESVDRILNIGLVITLQVL